MSGIDLSGALGAAGQLVGSVAGGAISGGLHRGAGDVIENIKKSNMELHDLSVDYFI